jgi:hypothetical protein
MGTKPFKHTVDEIITAIKGSGGIKVNITQKLGVSRPTLDSYLTRWVSVRQAYDEECQITDDVAESVIITNIRLALQKQKDTREPVDSSDSKWWVERRRRDKFSLRHEHTGADGADLVFRVVYDDGIPDQTS